jgi:16S rRNA (cytosine967-C5)-methyltransferase
MSFAENQGRTFLRLIQQLRPHWRRDSALPARIGSALSAQRSFGSRDRRLYRELIYTTLRYLPWIEPHLDAAPEEALRRIAWLAAETPATKAFCAAFATGEPPSGDKTQLLPDWFRAHCPALFMGDELEAQLRRAPLWLRLQTDEVAAEGALADFQARGWQWRRSPVLPDAVELLSEADVTKTDAWDGGLLEVQDLGSQLILASVGVEPGGVWLDACAGAGGKTLQLGRLLGRSGRVDAHDVRNDALAELERRVERARQQSPSAVNLADVRVLSAPPPHSTSYDGVLVDAPCSGSGTWRRAPHLKWVTTEAQVSRAAEQQRSLLDQFSPSVRSGGRLVYATCSLSQQENEDVVAAFLAAHPEFGPATFAHTFGFEVRGNGLTIMPSRHDTDGFFVASLRRR